jgi:superfamily II DNA or RNA helicase
VRRDGHHPIIVMQCGPIRVRVDPRRTALERPFNHIVRVRNTSFGIPEDLTDPNIQQLYAALVENEQRNSLIVDEILASIEEGRSPLVLSERVDQLRTLAQSLEGFVENVVVLRGGMGKRQRRDVLDRIEAIPEQQERVILATGRHIGEGFDDARLDTLFLALPISWRGTLQQYAGRLHRSHDGKREVRIYDFVDLHVPVLLAMYRKRLTGYRAIGYDVSGEVTNGPGDLILDS